MKADEILIDEKFLLTEWNKLFNAPDDLELLVSERVFIKAFQEIVTETSSAIEPLYFKVKAWRIPVSKNLLHSSINTALLCGVWHCMGFHQMATVALPNLFNTLFVMERVVITKKEEKVYLSLPLQHHFKSSHEWYQSLPAKVKREVKEIDFHDFLEKFVYAGLAKKVVNDEDEIYLILAKDDHKFKLHFF